MKSKKLVFGVGINDANYVTQEFETVGYVNGKRKRKLVWCCPYYRVWRGMLERCYSDKYQESRPTYKGCSVSGEWLTFSVFKSWMECQDWEGKQLDKDLLFEGNKVYSDGTCVFVTKAVNLFTTDSGAARGEWPIGVYWNKEHRKFVAQCSNPYTKKIEFLGYFSCPNEAHQVWLKRKLELAHLLAAEQADERVAKALIEGYTNYGVTTTLTHNGYTGSTQYCTTDNVYFGKLLHIDDLVCYDAHTEAGLKIAFEDAVDDYLSVLDLVHQSNR